MTSLSFVMTGPINNATAAGRQDARTPDWALPGVQEFVPGRLDSSALVGPVLSCPLINGFHGGIKDMFVEDH